MKIIIYISIIFLFTACRHNRNENTFSNDHEKQFYTNFEGLGYIRIPLIMPYEILAENKNDNWYLNLIDGFDYYYSIQQIDKVAVIDSVILIHSASIRQVSKNIKPKQWFAIIPSKNVEIGFANEIDFKEYLNQCNITIVEWMEIESVFDRFKDTECLPWIKGCARR